MTITTTINYNANAEGLKSVKGGDHTSKDKTQIMKEGKYLFAKFAKLQFSWSTATYICIFVTNAFEINPNHASTGQ